MKICIYTVTHKDYWLPTDSIYRPIQVGSGDDLYIESGKLLRDDEGDNISFKNSNYCELTALYWAWKNDEHSDYIGLDHYRRHFKGHAKGGKKNKVLSSDEVKLLLEKYDVILPKKRHYYIETNYSQYAHAHHASDLDETGRIIDELFPDYSDSFRAVMGKRSGHRFNMIIARRDIIFSYAEWLFAILDELERRVDISEYSEYDKRLFGFISERLLDVYFYHNSFSCKEVGCLFMEKQHWYRKIRNFLKRKFLK